MATKTDDRIELVVNRSFRGYNAGQRAFWSPADAKDLLEQGLCRHLEPEPEGDEEVETIEVPTLEEVLERGYEPAAAHGIVASTQALADGKSEEEAAALGLEAYDAYVAANPPAPPAPPPADEGEPVTNPEATNSESTPEQQPAAPESEGPAAGKSSNAKAGKRGGGRSRKDREDKAESNREG